MWNTNKKIEREKTKERKIEETHIPSKKGPNKGKQINGNK